MITVEKLKAIIAPLKYQDQKLADIVHGLNQTFTKYDISSSLRQNHFLAQVLHESMCFKYSEEIWGNTLAQQSYDTRVDLGNTPQKDGDGFKYRGRGYIQLTGKANYKFASKEFGVDFVTNPDLAGKSPYNVLLAGWYWNKHKLNAYADTNNIKIITKKINGGYNGFNDRVRYFEKCKIINI